MPRGRRDGRPSDSPLEDADPMDRQRRDPALDETELGLEPPPYRITDQSGVVGHSQEPVMPKRGQLAVEGRRIEKAKHEPVGLGGDLETAFAPAAKPAGVGLGRATRSGAV